MYKIKKEQIDKIKVYGTVREVAKETGISENYISQVLNNKKRCAKKSAIAISKALNLEVENLFDII